MLKFFGDALQQINEATCATNGGRWENGACLDAQNSASLATIIGNLSNIIFFVIGLLAVAILIYGGVQYIISDGNASKIERAKTTITWAIVGLIVAIAAYAIVRFIIANVTK